MKISELKPVISQQYALLYRKWFLTGHKDKANPLDKEQVEDLAELNYDSNKNIITYVKNQSLPGVRVQIPITTTHPTSNSFVYLDEILIIGNTMMSVHLPGTIGIGQSIEDGMNNYLKAIIENIDYHLRYNISLKDQDRYFKHVYNPQLTDTISEELINQLSHYGWVKVAKYPFNIMLANDSVKSIITIPHDTVIPASIQVWFNKLEYPMTEKAYYQDYPINSYPQEY